MSTRDRDERWPLSPRAARVLYNVADAWSCAARCAEPIDVVAALAKALDDPPTRRRVERTLWIVEHSPCLALHSRRGFSWLPRAARRAWLARLSRRAPRPVRAGIRELHDLLEPLLR